MVAQDGGIFAFGDAAFHGSMGGRHLNAMDRSWVWLRPRRGRAIGDSWPPTAGSSPSAMPVPGSMGSQRLNRPVGMVGYGDGYLMVASDGGIFDFSDKAFVGSLGSSPPANPIVAVTPLRG